MYGKELILDLCGCDVSKFNRKSLKVYFRELCKVIDMQPCLLTFWDDKWTWLWKLLLPWDETIRTALLPHTKGTSAVQFILTSNVTVHTLDLVGECYINIFSCKDFDKDKAIKFTRTWFQRLGAVPIRLSSRVVIRGGNSKVSECQKVYLDEAEQHWSRDRGRRYK